MYPHDLSVADVLRWLRNASLEDIETIASASTQSLDEKSRHKFQVFEFASEPGIGGLEKTTFPVGGIAHMLEIIAEDEKGPGYAHALEECKRIGTTNTEVIEEFLTENRFLKARGFRVFDALFDDIPRLLAILVRQVTKDYAIQALKCCERLYTFSEKIGRRKCLYIGLKTWIKKNERASSQSDNFAVLEARLLHQEGGLKDLHLLDALSKQFFEAPCNINGLAMSAAVPTVYSRIAKLVELDFESAGFKESLILVNTLLKGFNRSRNRVEHKKIVSLIRNSNFLKPIMIGQSVSSDIEILLLEVLEQMMQEDLAMVNDVIPAIHCISFLVQWAHTETASSPTMQLKIARVLTCLVEHANLTDPNQQEVCVDMLFDLLQRDVNAFDEYYYVRPQEGTSISLGTQVLKCLALLHRNCSAELRARISRSLMTLPPANADLRSTEYLHIILDPDI